MTFLGAYAAARKWVTIDDKTDQMKIMGHAAFPLRPMGLIHITNTISQPRALEAGMTVNLVVAARNYRKTDAGLAFDMVTEARATATRSP